MAWLNASTHRRNQRPFAGKALRESSARLAETLVQTYLDEVLSAPSSLVSRSLPLHAYWQANARRCPQLSELAMELTSVPATTPGPETIFVPPGVTFDPTCLLVLPERLERDTLLRFNHALVPRAY